MMNLTRILAITLISLLLTTSGVTAINADLFKTLKVRQDTRPSVCIFEPSPDVTDNWNMLKVATLMGVYEWQVKLEQVYPDGDWDIIVHDIIPWEHHQFKTASEYKHCNIMINFEKTHSDENSTALGTTNIQFQNSNHKFMFINIYLEHTSTSKNITIVMGEPNAFKVELKKIILSPIQVRNIVLHEMGHALGLEHYNLTTGLRTGEHGMDRSAMYFSMNLKDNNQHLTLKNPDILMIKKLYGEDGWLGDKPVWITKSCIVLENILQGCN